jgi:hypothetical protein
MGSTQQLQPGGIDLFDSAQVDQHQLRLIHRLHQQLLELTDLDNGDCSIDSQLPDLLLFIESPLCH